jgi:ATP-dependent helicase/DNAse subunit B
LLGESWKHLELLNDIANQEFDDLNYQGLMWDLEKEIYFGNDLQPGLWKRFMSEEEQDFNSSGFKPALFEIEFGESIKKQKAGYEIIPFSIENSNHKIKLNGKIDRVDIDDQNNAIVIDYKTGKSGFSINFNDIFAGLSLQLPVYLTALREIIKSKNFKMDAIACGYYLVKDADNCQRKMIFADIRKKPNIKISRGGTKLPILSLSENEGEFGLDDLIRKTKDFISDYTDNLFKGNFRHTKYQNNLQCSNYCTYKMVCRKDVGKIQAMNET